MGYEIRPATAGEMDQVGLMASYLYGGAFGDGPDNVTATSILPEWTLCAFDGPRLITSFATFPFTMRANGRGVDFGGVTAVGTLPEYRRQGLVRQIITRATLAQKEAGQSVAGLWASQAAIYQRYGYAAAGYNRNYSVDTVDIAFNQDVSADDCRVGRVSQPDALATAKGVYREFIAQRMGYLHRSQALWRNNAFAETEASGPIHLALAEQDGKPLGYVTYSLRANKVAHRARTQEIQILDMAWLDISAYVALWEFLAAHDLVGRVVWKNAPVDDPAPLLFREPRLLHTVDEEGSWVRIVDVPAALCERGYCGDGRVSIEITGDTIADWNNGAWSLKVDAGNGQLSRADTGDLRMNIATLSLAYTGMCRVSELAAWELVKGDAKHITTADQIFSMPNRPHCPDHY